MSKNKNSSGIILSPAKIQQKYETGKISKFDVISLISLLIEEANSFKVRKDALKLLASLNVGNCETFRILEFCLISDENQYVRRAAVRIISSLFPTKSLSPLVWAMQNEKSSIVLITLLNLSKNINDLSFTKAKQKRISQLEELYGVLSPDIEFVLKLQIFVEKISCLSLLKENFFSLSELLNHPFKSYAMHYRIGEVIYNVLNKKIVGLNLPLPRERGKELESLCEELSSLTKLEYLSISNLISIPKSLSLLYNLKALHLNACKRLSLPNSIINLRLLQNLKLNKSFFNPVSKSLSLLVKQNIAPRYIEQGVNSYDAISLGLLSVYIGRKLEKDSNIAGFIRKYATSYDINMHGYVVQISLRDGENYQSFTSIPNPVFNFEFLEKLIIRRCDISTVQRKIKKLKNLKNLDLAGNPVQLISDCIGKLHSLERLNLHFTSLRSFPEWVFQLNKLKYLNLADTQIPDSILYSKIERLNMSIEEFHI